MEKENLRLSVSKTKCFDQCKKQYKFSYILKFPKKEFEYHTFGKFCHKVLEDFHRSYLDGYSKATFNIEMAQAFKNALIEFEDKMSSEMRKEAWLIIDQYLKIITNDKNNNLSSDVKNVEEPFELAISNHVVLNGVIDRVQLDRDGVLHVADYKTTKNKKYLKDDWFQILTYCFVLINKYPDLKKIRGSYILLRHNYEYITKDFLIDEILEIKEKYLKLADDIESEQNFEASPTFLCKSCSFIEFCEEGLLKVKPQLTYGEVNW